MYESLNVMCYRVFVCMHEALMLHVIGCFFACMKALMLHVIGCFFACMKALMLRVIGCFFAYMKALLHQYSFLRSETHLMGKVKQCFVLFSGITYYTKSLYLFWGSQPVESRTSN